MSGPITLGHMSHTDTNSNFPATRGRDLREATDALRQLSVTADRLAFDAIEGGSFEEQARAMAELDAALDNLAAQIERAQQARDDVARHRNREVNR